MEDGETMVFLWNHVEDKSFVGFFYVACRAWNF